MSRKKTREEHENIEFEKVKSIGKYTSFQALLLDVHYDELIFFYDLKKEECIRAINEVIETSDIIEKFYGYLFDGYYIVSSSILL